MIPDARLVHGERAVADAVEQQRRRRAVPFLRGVQHHQLNKHEQKHWRVMFAQGAGERTVERDGKL